MKFVGITTHDQIDTTCRLPQKLIDRDKLTMKLCLLQGGESIILAKRQKPDKHVNVTKRNVDLFLVHDGYRHFSSNCQEKSMEQVLDNYLDCSKNYMDETADNKRKKRRKLHIV